MRDRIMLPEMHPDINHPFEEGHFTTKKKNGNCFSNTGLDHG